MLIFNSSSLRYKFIFLTRNIYTGISVHALFEDSFQTSKLKKELDDDISFSLIDKYKNFIPFSLRFQNNYELCDNVLMEDIIVSSKWTDNKHVMLTDVLFFIDMFNPEATAFVIVGELDNIRQIRAKLNAFLEHCYGVVNRDKNSRNSYFSFTLREQQVIFHMLAGMSIKQIADNLQVSDKVIYKDKDHLSYKIMRQKNHFGFQRTLVDKYKI